MSLKKKKPCLYSIQVIDKISRPIVLDLQGFVSGVDKKYRLEEIDQFTQQFANTEELLEELDKYALIPQVEYEDVREINIIHSSRETTVLDVLHNDTPQILSHQEMKDFIGGNYRHVLPHVQYAQQYDQETSQTWEALKDHPKRFYTWRESVASSYRNRRSLTIAYHKFKILPPEFYNRADEQIIDYGRERKI